MNGPIGLRPYTFGFSLLRTRRLTFQYHEVLFLWLTVFPLFIFCGFSLFAPRKARICDYGLIDSPPMSWTSSRLGWGLHSMCPQNSRFIPPFFFCQSILPPNWPPMFPWPRWVLVGCLRKFRFLRFLFVRGWRAIFIPQEFPRRTCWEYLLNLFEGSDLG